MIPLMLVGLFATGVWLAHEAWTTPVIPEWGKPRSRWRLLEEFLHQAGLHDVAPRDFVLFSLGGGVFVGAATQLVMGWPLVSGAAALLGAGLPYLWYATRHESRVGRVQAEVADAMDLLRDSIRAGGDVLQGMTALSEFGPPYSGPSSSERASSLPTGARCARRYSECASDLPIPCSTPALPRSCSMKTSARVNWGSCWPSSRTLCETSCASELSSGPGSSRWCGPRG